MKSLFDKQAHDEIVERLAKLEPATTRHWGKMSPSQMMEHSARALDVATGRVAMKQAFIGKLLGWMAWKKFMGEAPMPKNSPTGPTLIVHDDPDFDATRARLAELITDFHNRGESGADGMVHGFFGKLNGKQWGELQYKHVDHHLRQFGV